MSTFKDSVFSDKSIGIGTNVSTWNGAISYDSTSSSLVDLFFKLGRAFNNFDNNFDLLVEALDLDPVATLKIIFHARDPPRR